MRQANSKEIVCWRFRSLSKNDDFKLELREARKWVKLVTDSSESLAGRISRTDISCELDITYEYSEKMEKTSSYCWETGSGTGVGSGTEVGSGTGA